MPSASLGGKVDLFEPIHGSAPKIAGKGIANPIGAIASAALLLRHTAKLHAEADSVEIAIEQVLKSGMKTADLLPPHSRALPASTEEMGQRIAEATVEALNSRMAYFAV